MGWWRGRRGYGQLRLPAPRRAQRRTSWLNQELRARRAELLRSHWTDLLTIVAAFAVADLAVVLGLDGRPLLQAAAVGAYLGAITVGMVVFLALADGSLLARLGRMVEDDVGNELRKTPGVFGVISGVSFEHEDVDHVVLAPKGCYAIEVKALFGRPTTVEKTYGLAGKLDQAHDGARKVRALLGSHGVDLVVAPVLVLAGPGCPVLNELVDVDGAVVVDGVLALDGVLVVAFRDSATWRPGMAAPAPTIDLPTARSAATALLAYAGQRHQHRLAQQRQHRTAAVPAGG